MTKMTVTKVLHLLLILSCVLGVPADTQHEDIGITGCSAVDGEDMYALDGEELFYADFEKEIEEEPQPDFIDHMTIPGGYEQAVANQHICKDNLEKIRRAMKNPAEELDPPSILMIYNKDNVELGEKNFLICHVSGFYPAPVNVSWTKNSESVTRESSINVPYPNKDGSFRQASRLEFIPQQGDIYSCTVQHPALEEPMTRMWEVEVQQPGVGPSVFCGLGLTLGLLGVATGTFFLIKGNECN